MGRLGPEGLVGIHMNLFVPGLLAPQTEESDEERTAAEAVATFRTAGFGYFFGASHTAANHRLRPAGFTRCLGSLVA